MPNTPDEAPAGLDSTGDSIIERIWTLLRTPWVAIPVTKGLKKLPASDQIIAMIADDTEGHVIPPRIAEVPLCRPPTWIRKRVA